MTTDLITFEDYSDRPMFRRIGEMAGFSLSVDIPRLGDWADDKAEARALHRVYDNMREVVRAAGFHYENELRPGKAGRDHGIVYEDDRFDFSVTWDSERILLTRRGSKLANFHEWYAALMPSAPGIINNIASVLGEEQQRKIDILRGSFRFKFLIYDIVNENTNRPARNTEIVRRLVTGFPDERGVIVEGDDVLGSIGRVDVSMTRWLGESGRRRLVRYSVEAPANMAWSALWFTFSYGGESYTSPDGRQREAFDADTFLTEYAAAYVSFLRDSAVDGFMQWLLRGYLFKTTAGNIP